MLLSRNVERSRSARRRPRDRLERNRTWRHPRQVLGQPNVPALYSFTEQRRARVSGISRQRRLDIMRHKLQRAYDGERRRQMVEDFLNEPAPPVDPGWLEDFLGGTARRAPRGS